MSTFRRCDLSNDDDGAPGAPETRLRVLAGVNVTISDGSAFSRSRGLPAAAEYARIQNKSDFVAAVNGKRLTRPLVNLQVTPGGAIAGKGAAWQITGSWSWKDGYFCRTMFWGRKELAYNCQLVEKGAGWRFREFVLMHGEGCLPIRRDGEEGEGDW